MSLRRVAAVQSMLFVASVAGFGAAARAASPIGSVQLTLRGHTSLPSPGLDGQTIPRGKNGDVAILGKTAFVAGGSRFHGARASAGRICTDYGGVKVVDISDPAHPIDRHPIPIQDTKGTVSPPVGNVRRGLKLDNVSTSASSLSAMHFTTGPQAGKDILAIATQRCEQSFFTGAGIEFWDVTNPAAPARLGSFIGPPDPAPPGVKEWGIFEDVRMFTRADKPGHVFAVATTPFSVGNAHSAIATGDFRLLDVTDPANAVQIGDFPSVSIGQSSNNGCKTFQGGRSAAPTPDGKSAIFSFYDGAQPSTLPPNTAQISEIIPTGFSPNRSAAVFDLSLDNLPQFVAGPITTFSPLPPSWGFAPGQDGGTLPGGGVAPEGNAADVQPWLSAADGHLLSFVSEEGFDPALTNVTIDGPGAPFSLRGCENPIGKKLYSLPNQSVSGSAAYVGRGCPGSPIDRSPNPSADPYLQDPAGKVAVFESGGSSFDGCSTAAKIKRAAAAGATAAVFNQSCCPLLGNLNSGPDGPIPSIPSLSAQIGSIERMVVQFPNRVPTGTTFPPSWDRSTTSNVTLRPYAIPVTGATNTSPVVITTTSANGLSTGDHVTVADVRGNTAANGTFTVTVLSATGFQLDGTTGNGAYTGGGYFVICPPGAATCSVPPDARSDFSRFYSVANATDPVARAETDHTVVTASADVPRDATAIPVLPLPAALPSGAIIRFANRTQAQLTAAASAGATTLSVSSPFGEPGLITPIPAGTTGSAAPEVVGGQQYRAGVSLGVDSYAAGTYHAVVVWYDNSGAPVGTPSEIASVSALSPRTHYEQTVTAPANAVRATMRFEWTGAGAAGAGAADSFFLVPAALHLTLKDNQGQWGAQRIIDFSRTPPTELASYRSPSSLQWPPRNDGIYAPSLARMLGNNLAFTTWMSDGLRVLDVSNPSAPREVASFVPPDVADPSPGAGAGPSDRAGVTGSCGSSNPPSILPVPCLQRGQAWPNRALAYGVAISPQSATTGLVAVSDINGGLYLLSYLVKRPAPVITGFSVRPRTFSVAPRTTAPAARPGHPAHVGSSFRYSLSEAATIKIAIRRVVGGRRIGGRCVAVTKRNRARGHACSRLETVGTLTRRGRQGANVTSFSGRIGRRALAIGRYVAMIQATDSAGDRSATRSAAFRVVAR